MEMPTTNQPAARQFVLFFISPEKQDIEIPDYSPTLAKIDAALADLPKHMKAFP